MEIEELEKEGDKSKERFDDLSCLFCSVAVPSSNLGKV